MRISLYSAAVLLNCVVLLCGCNQTRSKATDSNDEPSDVVAMSRDKPHANIGVIGNSGQGHVRLAVALAATCTAFGNQPSLDELHRQSIDGFTFLEYESDAKHYAHIVFPRQTNLGNIYQQLASLDGCVLYLGKDGITPTTRAQLLMATAVGVSKTVVFVDDRSELSGDTSDDLTSLLRDAGFEASRVPIVYGSTRQALEGATRDAGNIMALVSIMDRDFVPRRGGASDAFLMSIDDVFSIAGRGVVVTGRVERGIVRKNKDLEIVGHTGIIATRCVDIETFNQKLDAASPGDHVGILIDNVDKSIVVRGMVLSQSGSLLLSDRFAADVYLENAAAVPTQADFLFRTAVLPGEISADADLPAGESWSSVTVRLSKSYGLEDGLAFAILVDGEFAGIGKVTSVQQLSK